MKKIMSILLSIMMTFASFTAVCADGGVAKVEGLTSQYSTFEAAIEAANTATGDVKTVTLLQDCSENIEVSLTTSIIINGNDKKMTGKLKLDGIGSNDITIKKCRFETSGLDLKNFDDVIIEYNTFNSVTNQNRFIFYDALVVTEANTATITNNTIDGADEVGIDCRDIKTTATITGNTVKNTKHNSIQVVKADKAYTPNTIITNNTLENWGCAPKPGKDVAEGRALRGQVNGLTFNNNVMKNTNAPEEFVKLGGSEGAIDVSKNYWNGYDPNTKFGAKSYDVYLGIASDKKTEIKSYYLDKEMTKLVSYDTKVAKIGEDEYSSLEEAIEAVKEGETIKILTDVTNAHGITVASGKNFTIDFNNHTYTISQPGAGSSGTESNGFQLLKGSTITFKNGTINCPESNKTADVESGSGTTKGIRLLIQNYCNLTLTDMVIDGTNLAHRKDGANNKPSYVVSNNCGTVKFDGNTSIVAADGDFAFDAYKDSSYNAPKVTVDSTGEFKGKVEVSNDATLEIESGKFTDLGVIKYQKYANNKSIEITLNDNCTLTQTIDVVGDVRLHLNGKNIEGNKVRVFNVKNNGKLQIDGNGTVISTWDSDNDSSVIRVGSNNGTSTDDSILVIGKDVTVSSDKSYGVTIFGKEQKMELIVDGTISTVKRSAISGNGSPGLGSTYIKVGEGANITTTEQYAIYHPQFGTLDISGSVEGQGGVELKSGNANVLVKGTIKATAAQTTSSKNNNGTSTSGYALAVVENSGYGGGVKVSIGENAKIDGQIDIVKDDNVESSKVGKIEISSGLYSKQVKSDFIVKGYACKPNEDTTYAYKVVAANEESHKSVDVEGDSKAKVESFVTGEVPIKETTGLLTAVDSKGIVSQLRTNPALANAAIEVKVFLDTKKFENKDANNDTKAINNKLDSSKGQVINDWMDLKLSQDVFVDGTKNDTLSLDAIQPRNFLYIPIELRDDYNGLEARIIVFTKHGSNDPVQMQRAATKYDAERYNGNCYYIENGSVVIKSKDFSVYGIGLQTANVPEYRYVAPTTPKSKGYVAPKTGVE